MFLNMRFRILILSLIFNYVYCKMDVIVSVKPEDSAIHITNEKFFSVAYDTNGIYKNFKNFDMKNERLFKSLKELAPGYMRVGGKMADRLTFTTDSTRNDPPNFEFTPYIEQCLYEAREDCYAEYPNFTMSGDDWETFNNFLKKLNIKVLFDFNSLLRHEDGSWDSKNAEELISFSAARNFDIDWTLSNEPNSHLHIFHYAIDPAQLAKDFGVLRNILNKYPQYKNSVLAGPDVTEPLKRKSFITRLTSEQYLKQFLAGLNNENPLDAIGFHQYHLNGHTAVESDFLNPATYTYLEKQINAVHNIAKNAHQDKLQVWLTETGSAFGGGVKGLSDRFVATFLWLDKLGLSAKLGIDVVVRQSIVGSSNYALLDSKYYPNPDWWLSILYKKFVGHEVLNCYVQGPDTVRLYCQCHPTSDIPTITIFGINFSNSTAHVQVEGIEQNQFSSSAYILTIENPNDLTTKSLRLNGKELKLTQGTEDLPEFHPKHVDVSKPLKMPAYSLAFWTVPAPDAEACTQ